MVNMKCVSAILILLLFAFPGFCAAQQVTVQFTQVPSTTDVPNPGRGVVCWSGRTLPTSAGPFIEYSRFTLNQLEPKVGVYDWAPLDKYLAECAAKGEKFSLRVMAYDPGYGPKGGNSCPSDFSAGFWHTLDGVREFVPDWNSPAYIAMFTKFESACAARYNHDNRVYSVDVGAWGDWNECHDYKVVYPQGYSKPTDATVSALVSAFAPWTHVHLISMTDDPRVLKAGRGWKRDSLGALPWKPGVPSHFIEGLHQTPEQWEIVSNAYLYGPVMLEWFGGKMDFDLAALEAPVVHPSLICSGPMDTDWKALSDGDQKAIQSIIAGSGFHDAIASATYPSAVHKGHSFSIESSWTNTGCAPVYDPWDITWELSDSSTKVVWKSRSKLDLRQLISGSLSSHDKYTLPKTVPPGSYTLSVIVNDPGKFWPPLRLAIPGRTSDGRYVIGKVTVGR
jgi:hypothetical protein